MSNRGPRRSPPEVPTTQTQTRAERARALALGRRATSHRPSNAKPDRLLTIREKIIRWLDEKL